VAAAILLCGFMATGKSTVGAQLASALGRRFVDLDLEILRTAGVATIAELFAREQESGFRRREAEELRRWSGVADVVVALGGGAVASDAALATVRSAGALLVCLDAGLDDVLERVGLTERPSPEQLAALRSRPLLAQAFADVSPALLQGDGLSQAVAVARGSLGALWAGRRPWYAQAALTVHTAGRAPGDVVSELLAQLPRVQRGGEAPAGEPA
jgi:shikimate kinase